MVLELMKKLEEKGASFCILDTIFICGPDGNQSGFISHCPSINFKADKCRMPE